MPRNKIVNQLLDQLELEGLEPGTTVYDHRLVAIKVEKCQNMNNVLVCSACKHEEYCSLVKEHRRNILQTPKAF